MDQNFSSLFLTRVPFRGYDCGVELRIPSYGELFGLILTEQQRTPERMAVMMPAEFKRVIRSINGKPVSIEDAREIYAEPQAAGRIIAARNQLFETLAEQGRVFLQCPHCKSWEAELSVLALTVALQAGPWPIIDQRMFLAVPSLAWHFPPCVRVGPLTGTSRIRFQLPSAVIGLTTAPGTGVLDNADRNHGADETMAWQRWVDRQSNEPGHEQWRHEVPGFRAGLRLAVALEQLDGMSGEITPSIVLSMPAVDFYFLDNLHYLTHNVTVQDEHKASVGCGLCGRNFLLVVG